jgi:hypothetical protein
VPRAGFAAVRFPDVRAGVRFAAAVAIRFEVGFALRFGAGFADREAVFRFGAGLAFATTARRCGAAALAFAFAGFRAAARLGCVWIVWSAGRTSTAWLAPGMRPVLHHSANASESWNIASVDPAPALEYPDMLPLHRRSSVPFRCVKPRMVAPPRRRGNASDPGPAGRLDGGRHEGCGGVAAHGGWPR